MRDCKTCVDNGKCTVDDMASCAHGDNIGHSDYIPQNEIMSVVIYDYKNTEWLKTEDGYEYKDIGKNELWEIIRFKHDAALYSFCPYCGYIHPCYKNIRHSDTEESNFSYAKGWDSIEYDPEKEFNFCPMCSFSYAKECVV